LSAGSVLQRWWEAVDGFSDEDPGSLLAADLQWRISYGERSRGGGRDELLAYAVERAAPGRRHGIVLAQVVGGLEVVAGHLLVHEEPVASFAATAQRDADGRMCRFLAGTAEDVMLAFDVASSDVEPGT
jgi:hypothetical protein